MNPGSVGERERLGVLPRSLLTLTALALAWMARGVFVPGLDVAHYEFLARGLAPGEENRSAVSVVALWVMPLVFASVAVEIAAMIVPRWRPLRAGGGEGRAKLLRWTIVLTFVGTILQCLFIVRWMSSNELLEGGPWSGGLLLMLSLTAAVAGLMILAEAIRLWGFGHGLSLLVLLHEAPFAWNTFLRMKELAAGDVLIAQRMLLVAAALVVLVVGSVRVLSSSGKTRLPLCGLLPVLWAQALPDLLVHLEALGGPFAGLGAALPRGGAGEIAGTLLATALLGALIALAVGGRGPDEGRAIVRSVVFVLAVAACDGVLWWQLGESMAGTSAIVVISTAVARDLTVELAARRRIHRPSILRTLHNVHAAAEAQRALEEAGIPSLARGLNHRTLLLFMGPYIAVDLLVPEERRVEAEAELERLGTRVS